MNETEIALFLASAVRLAGPVLLAALGEVVSERAGVFNVGLEGMMLFGAFGAVAGTQATGSTVVGAFVAVGVGGLSALILGVIIGWFRADQIVAGIGFNLLALGLTTFLRNELLASSAEAVNIGLLGRWAIPGLSNIPVLGEGLFTQSPLIYLAGILAVVLWLWLRFSVPGLALRSVGENANAADAAGVPVVGIRVASVAFAGVMAGLGGALLALVQTGGLFVDNMSGGRGYLAIAITIFGRWNPLWVCVAALLFGAADALQYQGQTIGISVPTPILLMFPFVLALAAWVLLGRGRAAPQELGKPFVRGG